MEPAAEIGRNPVSKHQIQSEFKEGAKVNMLKQAESATASYSSRIYREYVSTGEHAETGNLALTAAAAVSCTPATIVCMVCTIAAAAAMFCFQGDHDKENGGTGARGSSA